MRRFAPFALAAATAACAPSPSPSPSTWIAPADAAIAGASARANAPQPSAFAAPPAPPPDPAISFAAARRLLFLEADAGGATAGACAAEAGGDAVRCLLRLRYAADPSGVAAALRLYDATGSVAGLEPEQDYDGGWRGKIHFVPELPIGRHRRHLDASTAALEDLARLVADVKARAPKPVSYRVRDLAFRFFRSVNRTTPSAFAERWSIGYNVSGSLLGTAEGVRETLAHEIFHLNDEATADAPSAGGAPWSQRVLGPIFDRIVAKCGTNSACLAPYAPNDTRVRGGTFYAFQPGGGAHEYAAELAVRYVKETRAAATPNQPGNSRKTGERAAPFQCGPDENARAWAALVDAFFGGVEPAAACHRPPP